MASTVMRSPSFAGRATGAALEFEHRRVAHAAAHRGERPDGWDVDHVARQERGVLGLVSGKQQIVEVEFGDHLGSALQLDRAHRALWRGATRGKERVDERGERTHGVRAGALGVAYDEYAHRAQLAERDYQLEVAEHAPDGAANDSGQVLVARAGDVDRTHLRNAGQAVAIDHRAVIDAPLAPGAHLQLVARADDVVGGSGDVSTGAKTAGPSRKRFWPKSG